MTKPPHNLKGIASLLAEKGRGGDTMLAHINPQEAALLKALGGSGTINPETGLPEYLPSWLSGGDSIWSGAASAVTGRSNSGGGGGGGSFFGGLYDATIGQVVGPHSITGDIVEGVRDLGGSAVATIRNITGDTAESIQKVASQLGHTVEQIASDPKKMAAVVAMIVFPEAAGELGEYIMGEAGYAAGVEGGAYVGSTSTGLATVAGEGAAASASAKVVGQTAINYALNGGDFDKAAKAAALQYGVPALANEVVQKFSPQDMGEFTKIVNKYGPKIASDVGVAAIMKQDPMAALLMGGASAAADVILTKSGLVPNIETLSPAQKDLAFKVIAAKIQKQDLYKTAASSLLGSGIAAARDIVQAEKSLGTPLSERQMTVIANQVDPNAGKMASYTGVDGQEREYYSSNDSKADGIRVSNTINLFKVEKELGIELPEDRFDTLVSGSYKEPNDMYQAARTQYEQLDNMAQGLGYENYADQQARIAAGNPIPQFDSIYEQLVANRYGVTDPKEWKAHGSDYIDQDNATDGGFDSVAEYR